ncbi:hypothetical protein [Neobacillus sp.]|uniref:hypothetical protein n=1 Tax=Neobacillus sp. TaxID=2675273 RepID=UPI0035B52B6F
MNLIEIADQKLKVHHQNNQEFNYEFINIYNFYKEKLSSFVKDADIKRLEEELFQSIKAQIFNGYFMALELLNGNADFNDEWFMQSKGVIAQQIPEMLKNATNNDIEGIIMHSPLKSLTGWLVIEYEGVFSILLDIALNTACMGAKWAFIDEAEKRGITPYEPQYSGMLGYIDDIIFINPQTYLAVEVTTESSEVWTLINSKYNVIEKISEITIIKNKNNNNETYHMNIQLKNTLSISEQQALIDQLAVRLMSTMDIERRQLILSASSVEEFYEINNYEAVR